jgi:hypothetical protein
MNTDLELHQDHAELSRQFAALARVSNKEIPSWIGRSASTGITVASGIGAGAIMAFFKPKTETGAPGAGVIVNAAVAAGALVAGLLYKDNPDIKELGHSVARGFGSFTGGFLMYDGTTSYLATAEAKKHQAAAAAVALHAAQVAAAAPPPPHG